MVDRAPVSIAADVFGGDGEASAHRPRGHFLRQEAKSRPWAWTEEIGAFRSRFLPGLVVRNYVWNPTALWEGYSSNHDLFVVTSYTQPTMQLAMVGLALAQRRWALWGERPGVSANSLFRNVLRNTMLAIPKRFASCAIGTGELARLSFQNRFGKKAYSIPYFIDLKPFLKLPAPRNKGTVRFLFCGQLIPRARYDASCVRWCHRCWRVA